MSLTIGGGNLGGFPIYGAVANLSGAEVAQILFATSGLVKTLAFAGVGAIGLGALVIGSLANLESKPIPKIPLNSTIVSVKSKSRKFLGVSIDNQINFNCEGDDLTSNINIVNRVWMPSLGFGADKRLSVELIDGSEYNRLNEAYGRFQPNLSMKFLTITGIQTITPQHNDYGLEIRSATITEINELKKNLKESLNANFSSIVNTIGQDTFSKFFNVNQFKP